MSSTASTCTSSCVNDKEEPLKVRATYSGLHRWPESDVRFIHSLGFRPNHQVPVRSGPKVVDSISCRQIYLRSYTFTRKESVNERTMKCIGKVKDKVVKCKNRKKGKNGSYCKDRRSYVIDRASVIGRKVKEVPISVPCAALKSLFRKLLFCSARVDD